MIFILFSLITMSILVWIWQLFELINEEIKYAALVNVDSLPIKK